jgi:hypothetical protein
MTGVVVRVVLAVALLALAAAGALAQSLADSLEEVARRTREYRQTLDHLLTLQEQEAARAAASAEQYRGLEPRGFVSKREVETAERGATQAAARADETRAKISEAERIVVEAQALVKLASLPPPAPDEERATPEVVEYHGMSRWTLDQVASLERFFVERFGRPLPVSALGQTSTHDHLGFDHRNALDIAVHPDSVEGRALLAHLRARRVPFLAFRGAITGISTGAHVHVGAPSPRKI